MVYAQFLPVAGKLYLTQLHESFDADTFFPEIDFSQWKAVASEEVQPGEGNQYAHTYTEFIRS
jgi:dihydrofolate reductase